MNHKRPTDPIIDEIHSIRFRILAECDGDLHKVVQSVQKRQAEANRPVRFAPETPGRSSARQPNRNGR